MFVAQRFGKYPWIVSRFDSLDDISLDFPLRLAVEFGKFLGEVIGNPLLASVNIDRLTHHAHLIEIQGSSYRQKQRQAKQASKTKTVEGEK